MASTIPFSTGRKSRAGFPLRARACGCSPAWWDGVSCFRCGRWLRSQVDQTWKRQAARSA